MSAEFVGPDLCLCPPRTRPDDERMTQDLERLSPFRKRPFRTPGPPSTMLSPYATLLTYETREASWRLNVAVLPERLTRIVYRSFPAFGVLSLFSRPCGPRGGCFGHRLLTFDPFWPRNPNS